MSFDFPSSFELILNAYRKFHTQFMHTELVKQRKKNIGNLQMPFAREFSLFRKPRLHFS